MRCKTLADDLIRRKVEVVFITRDHPGNLIQILRGSELNVSVLARPCGTHNRDSEQSTDYASWLGIDQKHDAQETIECLKGFNPDWMIVDHYSLDVSWESMIRKHVKKIIVIDDIANRPHHCDILLDQNFHEDMAYRYDNLLPVHARKLLGPKYALLRSDFKNARENLRLRDGSINRILIFFGGIDPTRETLKALKAVDLLDKTATTVDVVVGVSNPDASEIAGICKKSPNTYFHCPAASMAMLMADADLFIGAGGSTSWERCCLGLPSIVKPIAQNQVSSMMNLSKIGAIKLIPMEVQTTYEDYLLALNELDSATMRMMQHVGMELVDGQGVDRIMKLLLDETHVC